MAQDINIGDDALLTTELADDDRITLTRAATGQQIASMTVADFMQKCAQMIPVATSNENGLMEAGFSGKSFLDIGQNFADFNQVKSSGAYFVHQGPINGPGVEWGMLLCFSLGGQTYVSQIVIDIVSALTYIRICNESDVWSPWVQLSN